jgi:hypothetical protein
MNGEAGAGGDGGPPTDDSNVQTTVENDRNERSLLERFVGRRPRKFLRTYDKAEEGRAALILNWAAFFVPLPWLFYRKLYLEGAIFAVIPALAAFIYLPASQILSAFIGLLFFLFGHGYYVFKALNRIETIEAGSQSDAEKDLEIQQSGGVSRAGAWFGALIVIGGVAYIGYATYVTLGQVAEKARVARQLPACDAQPARDLVKKVVSDRMAKQKLDAKDVSYSGFIALGESSPTVRRCGFQLREPGASTGLKFEISWQSPRKERYLVRLTGPQVIPPAARRLPPCDAQPVRGLVKQVLTAALAKENIDGKNLVYSNFAVLGTGSADIRRCAYDVLENGERTGLKFEISWQDAGKEKYQVRLTGAR